MEFKKDNQSLDEIGKRLSALANGAALKGQNFGYLVFGIEDGTHEVIGTTFRPNSTKKGGEELELWLSRMLSPRIDFRIYEFEFQGHQIALFHIPAAGQQPVRFQHEAWVRVGSNVKPLREYPEKERKLWLDSSLTYEQQIAKTQVSPAEVVALLDTQSVFDLLTKTPYPSTRDKVLGKMLEEKLIIQRNGHYSITNLGALLFAKNLDDFELQRKAPRVIKYKGQGRTQTDKDQLGRLGYGTGFERLINYVSALLPSNEVIEKATRREVLMFPPLAVRELVANAVIHQDLREQGTYLGIEIFSDRIEISNPGVPLVEPDRFIDSYNTRNPLLAGAMRRMGFCEEKGSGVDKVVEQCELFQLPAPDFRVKQGQTVAVLYAPQALASMDKSGKTRAAYQHCCLLYVNNRRMTNQSLRERFKIDKKNAAVASRILKDTAGAGLIRPEGSGNGSRKMVQYVPYWA